jgi:hypothetical protein
VKETDLAWLAGLWGGEGYIGIQRASGHKNTIWYARAQLEMTHVPTVDRAMAIVQDIGCGYRRVEMTG